MPNIYQEGLDRNVANYTPLTPLTFIARTAYVYPERMAVIHGQRRYTWLQTFSRARRLASALAPRVSARATPWRCCSTTRRR
jgi:fatty-acyl-CoA synthase